MNQIRVLLIEDHFLARMALHSVLSTHAQIQIVGEASDGEAGFAMFRSLRPDVVVLDLRLPRVSGFQLIVQLRQESPRHGLWCYPTTPEVKISIAPCAAAPWPISPKMPAAKSY